MSATHISGGVNHADFAKRLMRACDGNSKVPPLQYGRLSWFAEHLEAYGASVSTEGVRKWFAGETYPRSKAMTALARLLQVDEGWLASGVEPGMDERDRRRHRISVSGAANLVAGFIQMDGGHPAFPQEDDAEAEAKQTSLYAIIKGAKYNFHITAVIGEGAEKRFLVPTAAEGTVVLGVVRYDDKFAVRIFDLDWEIILDNGKRKGDLIEVAFEGNPWREIVSFSDRI